MFPAAHSHRTVACRCLATPPSEPREPGKSRPSPPDKTSLAKTSGEIPNS